METTFFVLGMLSIIGAIAIVLIIWGVLKINKLTKSIKQLEEWIQSNERNRWEEANRLRDDMDRKFEDVEHNIISHRLYGVNESKSYTDSRFDKATGLTGEKKLIKG
jgi:predicted Holliday junction resolvase-like endonuclease